jgi:pimeloyl-ACP methyl ester carboxylesterase
MHPQATDRYFTVDGARLRYRDEGSGPAVVLVHGWTLDLEMWNALSAALRARFRVIRFDRRGFGLSSGLPGLERDIADLDALWGHMALRRAARVVLGFAAASARKISCLVLDGPPDVTRAAIADDDELPLAQYRALARSEGIDAFRRQWSAHPLSQLRTADRSAHQLLHAILGRYPGTDLLRGGAPMTAPKFGPLGADVGSRAAPLRARSIATAVLVITGEYDVARRVESADLLAQRLGVAERAVVPDAGHLPNLDNPVAYNNLVRSFLDRHLARTEKR